MEDMNCFLSLFYSKVGGCTLNIVTRNNSYLCKGLTSRVHGIEEETKFHVPGYMDLKKKQNSMYPGT